jgi:hypothetical protein
MGKKNLGKIGDRLKGYSFAKFSSMAYSSALMMEAARSPESQ